MIAFFATSLEHFIGHHERPSAYKRQTDYQAWSRRIIRNKGLKKGVMGPLNRIEDYLFQQR
jgi:hypothetical protein